MQARPRIRSGITTSLRIHLSSCRTARSSEICGPAKSSVKRRTSGGSGPTPRIRHFLATGPVQAAKFRCSSWSPSSQLRRKNDEPRRNIMAKLEGKNVTGIQGDVSNLGDLDRLFAKIKQEKGKLDIVFANAGVATYAPLGAITEEHYDSTFNINVKGLLFTVQKALPLLPDGASIVLNASIVGSKGLPSNSVY